MKKQPTKLPDKPSALIRLALRDLEKCERSKLYKIDMTEWHQLNGKCTVCLAGAVMAQTLGSDVRDFLLPSDFQENAGKLDALDCFRDGDVWCGLGIMGLERNALPRQSVVPYKTSRTQFKRDMRKLATMLAKEGL